ncbi:MAG: transketolase [Candidatus Rokubacteria bacterium 13_2_20CM_2_70_11]|nr:MAG: transketolase [Candidatus Rokubacteria bacterium 13_2_20CM_2_70_11]
MDDVCINTIRVLSIDAVEQAASGHPGMPMGAAPMAYVLWTRHLRHDPTQPKWVNRDRFVLSAGHGSMLLYSLLFLTGYDLTLDDLKHFRRWGSRTPGHPERGSSTGIEVTTGPLGQGFGNAVGMAVAERWLAATFNRPGHSIVDHRTYVIASDGDLMEGVAAEAASLAGDLRLGRLIVLYDSNRITLSATTNVTFSEDVGARFAAYGWHVQHVDGMDVAAVDAALAAARAEESRPSLIVARTHIGFGSPHKQDTFQAHGEPLGADEVRLTKRAYGWPEDRTFYVPEEVQREFAKVGARGAAWRNAWQQVMDGYRAAHGELADEFDRVMAGQLPPHWDDRLPTYTPQDGAVATRDAGGKAIEALAESVPNLVGGSADLDPSTRTMMKGKGDFQSATVLEDGQTPPTQGAAGGVWGYAGRNIHFGIREHAMTAILTGMAHHGGVVPFGATFLTFSDYMRPSIRLAALSAGHVIYVWTHDSIALGEDGPTHQPVEQLASLRAMPNLLLLRPADANETVEAWRIAMRHTSGPVGLVLTRQKLPVLDRTTLAPSAGTARGAYVLIDAGEGLPELILIATGSEVSLALDAHRQLASEGVRSRVVSMPSWELFEAQSAEYRQAVLPPAVHARVSVEAGSPFGWERYVGPRGAIIGVERFGASAPGPEVMARYGFSVEHVVATAKAVLAR